MPKYPVKEIFFSIQGEGVYAGMPMVFVRFAGCNYACRWCDTDSNRNDPGVVELTQEEVVAKAAGIFPFHIHKTVCLTGGEPSLYDLAPLVVAFFTFGWTVHIETNGSRDLGHLLYKALVTTSPKKPNGDPVVQGNWKCHQLKIVDQGQPLELLQGGIFRILQPLWSDDPEEYRQRCLATAERVRRTPGWRLGIQLHKMLGVK